MRAEDHILSELAQHFSGFEVPQDDRLIFGDGDAGQPIRADVDIQDYPARIVAVQIVEDVAGLQVPVGHMPGFSAGEHPAAVRADGDRHDDSQAIADQAAQGAGLIGRLGRRVCAEAEGCSA